MKMNTKTIRIKIANDTLEILNCGFYVNRLGNKVQIGTEINAAIKGSILYSPTAFNEYEEKVNKLKNKNKNRITEIEVTGETTLAAAKRLIVNENISETACLNFASAKNPGGGFLNGSHAQEESLSRASALYPCIAQMKEMYNYNRNLKTCLYSDYMIYSPNVPVIRDDKDELLEDVYLTSFITAPAVNAGIVEEREVNNIDNISKVMIERIKKILITAALNNNRAIILGAYGCGVFRNKTEDVAKYFKIVLFDYGFKALFDKIVFAIYDTSANNAKIKAFQRELLLK